MARHIHFCKTCNKYTMKETCDGCGKITIIPQPPKYSPEDKYAKYRRQTKEKEWKKKGIL